MTRKLAAGNWKMNGLGASLSELEQLATLHPNPGVGVLICPPATLIAQAAAACQNSAIAIGGQDCHAQTAGAHTGDISAQMLADAGASHVILGHSERRSDHREGDADVSAKAMAAMNAGLTAVICIGESLTQREAGETLAVISAQLAGSIPETARTEHLVIAYEPIWAIGTGLTPTLEQIAEVHDRLRADLVGRFGDSAAEDIPLLYGGSVKPGNAAEIFSVANVDGALVGGASLLATDFSPIIKALEMS